MTVSLYDKRFYDGQSGVSRRSADAVVPLLLDLFRPKSVLDVGCGVGTWCAAFEANGVQHVHGLDGPWVERAKLQFPSERFIEFDFGTAAKPFAPTGVASRYDLVTTFEFLEHIDAKHARDAVALMTKLSDVVVAGAAVPLQGGRHHVNEQWPDYWREQFAAFGFEAFDALRPVLAHLKDIDGPYVQNSIVYVKSPMAEDLRARLSANVLEALRRPAPWVHPVLFTKTKKKLERSSISRRLKALFGRR